MDTFVKILYIVVFIADIFVNLYIFVTRLCLDTIVLNRYSHFGYI